MKIKLNGIILSTASVRETVSKSGKTYHHRNVVIDIRSDNAMYPNPINVDFGEDLYERVVGMVGHTVSVEVFLHGRRFMDKLGNERVLNCVDAISIEDRTNTVQPQKTSEPEREELSSMPF